MTGAKLLDASRVKVFYNTVEAVRGVSLHVNAGEIVTVIGANGAGKTTLLNALQGLLPCVGTVTFMDHTVAHIDVEGRVERGLCLVPERRELFGTMTVEDNLVLGGFRVDRSSAQKNLSEVFTLFPRLKERRQQLAGTLSGGERQMLAMGRALMSQPKLLMLDEPSLGLAPRIVADIFTIISDLRKSGVSILLVEQNAKAALKAADRAYVMELGEITLSGPAAKLAKDKRVINSYLGFKAK